MPTTTTTTTSKGHCVGCKGWQNDDLLLPQAIRVIPHHKLPRCNNRRAIAYGLQVVGDGTIFCGR